MKQLKTEAELKRLFYQFTEEQKLAVLSDSPTFTVENFVENFRSPKTVCYAIEQQGEFVAMCWYDKFEFNFCRGHFVCFTDEPSPVRANYFKRFLEQFFKDYPRKVVLGIIPTYYPKVCHFWYKYQKQIGVSYVGCLPDSFIFNNQLYSGLLFRARGT
jgi:hypothetical protein